VQDVFLVLQEKDRLGCQRHREAPQASIVDGGMTGEQSMYDIEDSRVFCRTNLKKPSSGTICRIGKKKKNQHLYCRHLSRTKLPQNPSSRDSCLSTHLVSLLVTHLVGFDSRILRNDACSATRSIKQDTVESSKHLQADGHLELCSQVGTQSKTKTRKGTRRLGMRERSCTPPCPPSCLHIK